MTRSSPAALLALALAAGCSGAPVPHVGDYQPRKRTYEVPPAAATGPSTGSPGSLWHDGNPQSMLFTDARAFRENDLVVIKIEEIADAKRSSDTDLTRKHQASGKFGLNMDGKPTIPAVDASGGADTTFKGEGSTARTERLIATVPAVVRKVLPNGNLFVEGHRVVLVNNEEQHYYISGVIRPIDIEGDNSVKSTMVADAEVEFTGRGVLSENQKKGWASKYLGWLWPF